MIDLTKVQLCANPYVDGVLDDGRFVEFKVKIPNNLDKLVRLIVAMANSNGGLIIFGVDERTMSVIGILGNCESHKQKIATEIKRLSIGITYTLITETINDKDVIILEINKSKSTSFFSRVETTPARQIVYKFKEIDKGQYGISNENEMRYSKVYKYMTLEAFLTSLYCRTWRFFEPSKWNDKFEQRFYCANYTLPAAIANTPQLFATCITRERNSEAAWKVYSHGQGLGAHCLQLELDVVELRKQLRDTGYQFEERPIEYISENAILDLHKKRKPYYKKYFTTFTLDSYLRLLSLKRDAYTYEKELRLFIIPHNGMRRNKGKKAQFMDINIDWKNIITRVRVDKKCSDAELVSIQRACFTIGINPVIKNYNFIGTVPIPSGLKDVEFEKFDIDEMPGTSSITIA